jgi:NTE family protein
VPGEGWLLVDGGLMNNVPADVVRRMGADRVVAINVGDLSNPASIDLSMLQAASNSITAMMRASTRVGLASADIQIDVPLAGYGSLDWRRSADIVREGYKAAEAMRDRLMPLAVSEAEFAAWKAERERRRRTIVPQPSFVDVEGFADNDRRSLDALLLRHVDRPLDIAALEQDLSLLTGLDRYETITWRIMNNGAGQAGLLVSARPKAYAPPFLMLGLNLENTTSADFQITATARYLTYGLAGSGSELRVDGTLGSNPAAGIELYEPLRGTRFFATAAAAVTNENATSLADDEILARYGINRIRASFTGGINLSRVSDLRIGGFIGRINTTVEIGDPGLPELRGIESGLTADWRLDTQDSPVVPSTGTLASVRLLQWLSGPDGVLDDQTIPLSVHMTQLSGTVNHFWRIGERNRLFAHGGAGTTFDETALPTDSFILGAPLALGAYRSGELRGSHYLLGSGGYLRQIGRLPDFLGGPIFTGGWLENGDAFDDWDAATWRTNASVGVIMDTLIGPLMLAGSAGFDGRWRTYIGIGRLFK